MKRRQGGRRAHADRPSVLSGLFEVGDRLADLAENIRWEGGPNGFHSLIELGLKRHARSLLVD
jgi:hypothetical protein